MRVFADWDCFYACFPEPVQLVRCLRFNIPGAARERESYAAHHVLLLNPHFLGSAGNGTLLGDQKLTMAVSALASGKAQLRLAPFRSLRQHCMPDARPRQRQMCVKAAVEGTSKRQNVVREYQSEMVPQLKAAEGAPLSSPFQSGPGGQTNGPCTVSFRTS